MANLAETAEWEDGIYQLETTDPVVGGPPNLAGGQGMSNVQAQQLAKRTGYLKAQVEALPNDLRGGVVAALDTLAKLATAINDDPDFAATVAAQLATKAPLASPAFTGTPTAPTQATGNESTRLATTAYVAAKVAAGIDALVSGAPGALNTLNELAEALGDDPNFASTITSQISTKLAKSANLSDVQNAATARNNLGISGLLDDKANLASPAFTGSPTAPTQAPGNSSSRVATTAFVSAAIDALNSVIPGIGQSWQNTTASRVSDTSYQNSTGRPITVVARAGGDLFVSTNNSTWVRVGESGSEFASMTAIVPPGHYFRVTGSITYIAELR